MQEERGGGSARALEVGTRPEIGGKKVAWPYGRYTTLHLSQGGKRLSGKGEQVLERSKFVGKGVGPKRAGVIFKRKIGGNPKKEGRTE